jgi:signal transduction histidine kinase
LGAVDQAAFAVAIMATSAVAVVLVVRRPRHPVTVVMAIFAAGGLWGLARPLVLDHSRFDDAMWALSNPMMAPLITVFPDGPRGRLGRRMLAYQILTIVWTFATGIAGYERGGEITWYFRVDQALLVGLLLTVVIGTVSLGRLWRRSTGERRTRIGIVFSVAAFWVAQVLVLTPLTVIGPQGPRWLDESLEAMNFVIILGGLPVAVGLGVLVERAGPLAGALNRALSWWLLIGIVAAGALLLSGAVSSALGEQEAPPLAVALPAVTVAVLAAPIRGLVRRPIDALLPRVGPEQVALRGLSHRLGGAVKPDQVPSVVAATLGEAFDAAGVHLEVEGLTVARWGVEFAAHDGNAFPLVQGGRVVGQLRLLGAEVADGSLEPVLPHVAAALESAHLAGELERSHDRLLKARSDERSRLRADLHDELSPSLAGMRLAAASIRERLRIQSTSPDPVADDLLARIESEAGESVHTIRRILADLRPISIDDLGLHAALRQRAMTFHRPGTFDVTFSANADLPALAADVEVAVYRTLAEAVNNAARHSQARHCQVRVGVAEGAVVVDVADDGIGLIDGDEAVGLGLRSMQARAESLGGRLRIEPVTPHGTRIVAAFPTGTDRPS